MRADRIRILAALAVIVGAVTAAALVLARVPSQGAWALVLVGVVLWCSVTRGDTPRTLAARYTAAGAGDAGQLAAQRNRRVR